MRDSLPRISCISLHISSSLFSGTRETAFIYAILSAGVVHATTQACSIGNLKDCTCDMSNYGEHDVEGWKWGGCSDNVNYGIWFSENFVDAPERLSHQKSRNIRNVMNLHNNKVGRLVSIVFYYQFHSSKLKKIYFIKISNNRCYMSYRYFSSFGDFSSSKIYIIYY